MCVCVNINIYISLCVFVCLCVHVCPHTTHPYTEKGSASDSKRGRACK